MVTQCPILPGQGYTYTFTVRFVLYLELISTYVMDSLVNPVPTGITGMDF